MQSPYLRKQFHSSEKKEMVAASKRHDALSVFQDGRSGLARRAASHWKQLVRIYNRSGEIGAAQADAHAAHGAAQRRAERRLIGVGGRRARRRRRRLRLHHPRLRPTQTDTTLGRGPRPEHTGWIYCIA